MSQKNYVTTRTLSKKTSSTTKKSLVSYLDIELTERCNNDCIHCYINLPVSDVQARKAELSTAAVKDVLAQAVSLGCMRVRFTGGEPLLREDFEDLYIFSRRQGLRVLIFTNATLINPRMVDLFKRIPPLEKIEITIYGMSQATYEAVTRNPGSFEQARRGVSLLLENNIPFVVKGAWLPDNKHEAEQFKIWAQAIPWMKGKPPSFSMFFNLHARRHGVKNREIQEARLPIGEGIALVTRERERYAQQMKGFCSKFMRPSGDRLFSCGAGIGGGCVDAYGQLQPCLMLRDPKLTYDLKKGSLKDALENFFPKIREMKTKNTAYLDRCGRCFLKGLCAQCPAISWAEQGRLDLPSEYCCEIAHAQARVLGLIQQQEKAWEVEDGQVRVKKFVNCK